MEDNLRMKLSKHFDLAELTTSQHAARKGIDNTPDESSFAALCALCEAVLEPLRVSLGVPVVVNSGYRSPRVNKAVGGSKTSQHMLGEAADIIVPGVPVGVVFAKIAELKLPVDQCIDEFGAWVHVSHRAGGTNRYLYQTARRENGRVVYAVA